jgi:signal transduction histidine kinase
MALRRGGQIFGLQTAGYRSATASVGDVQLRIAAGVAQLASLVLEHTRIIEELEHANRLKSDFVATVSHELRTPLHIIMGYQEILATGCCGPVSAPQADVLERMGVSAARLLELIDATLEVCRIDAGRVPVDLASVDLPPLLGEVVATFHGLQEKRGLSLTIDLAPGLPTLRTDPVKLRVVIGSLIDNALKFTESGGARVAARPRDGGVEIAVSDTGIGIPTSAFGLIFEAFRQVERPLTRRHDGMGLGLYIARRLTELLGGTIEVESTEGQGSTFRVCLPRTPKVATVAG